jgi:hypothetical protein
VLSEMNALRSTDNAPATTHYYGVVKVTYTSGVAGLGYVPGRAAMGWDYLPSGDGVAAHEFGHNFNRPHSPCGVSGDGTYPYSGGTIANYGWNPTTNSVVASTATDFMGYCNTTWTSDWTWSKVMTYRNSSGLTTSAIMAGAAPVSTGPVDGLLVWGRIVDGRVILEPAFRVKAPATPTPTLSSYRLQALDADGASLLDLPLEAPLVDHATAHEERQFAVVVPWSARLETSLASLRVRDTRAPMSGAVRGSDAAVRARIARTPITLPEPAAAITRAAGREQLRWDATRYPMAMVRDEASGQIVAFLRRTGDTFQARGRAVQLVLSDGVRSTVRRVPAGGQPE